MSRSELNEELVRMLDAKVEDAMIEYIKMDDDQDNIFTAFYYNDIELREVLKFEWDVSEQDYIQSLRNSE